MAMAADIIGRGTASARDMASVRDMVMVGDTMRRVASMVPGTMLPDASIVTEFQTPLRRGFSLISMLLSLTILYPASLARERLGHLRIISRQQGRLRWTGIVSKEAGNNSRAP